MAYKEVLRVEISEVIRRWQTGESRRHIALGTGLSKDTVGKYISAVEALGIDRDGPGPDEEQLSSLAAIGRSGPRQGEAPTAEKLAPWADQIYQWITVDRLQLTKTKMESTFWGTEEWGIGIQVVSMSCYCGKVLPSC